MIQGMAFAQQCQNPLSVISVSLQLAEPDGHNSHILAPLLPPVSGPGALHQQQDQHPPGGKQLPRVFDSYGQVQVPCLKALLLKDKRRQKALAEFVAKGRFSSSAEVSQHHHHKQQPGAAGATEAGSGMCMEVEDQGLKPGPGRGAACREDTYDEGDLDEVLTPAATFIRGQVGCAFKAIRGVCILHQKVHVTSRCLQRRVKIG